MFQLLSFCHKTKADENSKGVSIDPAYDWIVFISVALAPGLPSNRHSPANRCTTHRRAIPTGPCRALCIVLSESSISVNLGRFPQLWKPVDNSCG